MVGRGVPCEECTKNRETLHQQQKEHSPIVTRFFKIMFGKDDYSKFLYLPPKFARTMRHLADQETQIEDSSGDKWPVTLSYVEGSLAFRKGWNKFFLDHSIQEGQLLVFNYIKGSHFAVQIYARSACEIIFTSNNNEKPRENKRMRREDAERVCLEEEPVETSPDVSSKDKAEFMDHQTTEANNNCGELQIIPISTTNMEEDLTCMINRGDDGCYPEEDNFLFDLSTFEREKKEPESNKSEKGLDMEISPPPLTGTSEQIKEKGDGIETADIHKFGLINDQCYDVYTDKFEKATDTKSDSSRTVTDPAEQYDKRGDKDNPKSTSIDVNQTNGNSGEVFKDKVETKIPPSHTEIMGQTKTKGHDAQTVIRRRPITRNASGVFADKSPPNYSDKLSKGVQDVVSILQNGINQIGRSNSVSPSRSSSKIGDGVRRGFYECSVSSSVLKDSLGRRAVKKEVIELGEEARDFLGQSRGKELNVSRKHGEIKIPVVKVEPDLPFDTMPPPAISPFSAEVESLSYLELPVHIPSVPGRRERGRGKVVYLRDFIGTICPVLYPELGPLRAFTTNWRLFCQHNGILPGDLCRFQHENGNQGIYRVDVTRKVNQFPNEAVMKVGSWTNLHCTPL